jgi:hypothetical protein
MTPCLFCRNPEDASGKRKLFPVRVSFFKLFTHDLSVPEEEIPGHIFKKTLSAFAPSKRPI